MQKRGSGPAADRDLEQLAAFFKLLSDKTRVKIILLLAQGDRHVTSLCEELNLPQPTISHHLGLLRMSNIVGNRRQGKQVFYGPMAGSTRPRVPPSSSPSPIMSFASRPTVLKTPPCSRGRRQMILR